MKKYKTKKYPFEEGQEYCVICDNEVVRSFWDCESESLHTNNKQYFYTELEAIQHIKINKLYYLVAIMQESFEKIAFDDIDCKQEAKNILECIALYEK